MNQRLFLSRLWRAMTYLIHAILILVFSLYPIFIVRAFEPVFLPSEFSRQNTYWIYCSIFPLLIASLYFKFILGHKGTSLLKGVLFVGVGVSLLLFLVTGYVLAGLA